MPSNQASSAGLSPWHSPRLSTCKGRGLCTPERPSPPSPGPLMDCFPPDIFSAERDVFAPSHFFTCDFNMGHVLFTFVGPRAALTTWERQKLRQGDS